MLNRLRKLRKHQLELRRPVAEDVCRRSVAQYLGLVFVGSVVFWVLGPALGDLSRFTHASVPASALMLICPVAAAALISRHDDRHALRAWARNCVRYGGRQKRRWRAVTRLIFPAIYLAAYGGQLLTGTALTDGVSFAWHLLPVISLVYLFSAACEEAGWTGYCTEPMQQRYGALAAGAMIGAVWALWHLVPYLQGAHGLWWVAGQCVFTVLSRMLLVLLYNHTGRNIFATTIAHASSNVAWSLYPNAGSGYDPWLASAAATVALVALLAASGIPQVRFEEDSPDDEQNTKPVGAHSV